MRNFMINFENLDAVVNIMLFSFGKVFNYLMSF